MPKDSKGSTGSSYADIFKTVNKPIKKRIDSLINLMLDSSKGISKIDNVNDTTKQVRITDGIKIKYDKEKYIKQIEDIKLSDLNGKKQKT